VVEQAAQFEWRVSDDRLSVLFRVNPPEDSEPTLADDYALSAAEGDLEVPSPVNSDHEAELSEILHLFSENRIVASLDREAVIHELEEPSGAWVVIARGTPPSEPTDAALEYLVDLDNFNKPIVSDDTEKVDHKNLNLILNVQEGQALVRKHDAVAGEPGLDVFGEPIPPKEPMDVAIPPGTGVQIVEEGRLAVAAIDGAVAAKQAATLERRRGSKGEAVQLFEEDLSDAERLEIRRKRRISALNVTRLHRIGGDIGYKTGNIDFNGSVEISGNVLTGFEVRAADDIVVSGVVEGALLEAGGNITIAQGIQGGGKAHLKAGEGICARFANDARLEAKTAIRLATHLHNCQVSAGEEVHVTGGRGVIAGGEVRAGHLIRAKVVGSDLGVKTILQLGLVSELNQRIHEIEEAIEKETSRLAGLEEILMQLNKIRETAGGLPKDKEEIRIRAVRDQFKAMGNLDTLNWDLVNCQRQRENAQRGRVIVEQVAHEGVVVRFPEGIYPVDHAIRHLEFYFEENEVRTRAV
jgi:hypothetical protein